MLSRNLSFYILRFSQNQDLFFLLFLGLLLWDLLILSTSESNLLVIIFSNQGSTKDQLLSHSSFLVMESTVLLILRSTLQCELKATQLQEATNNHSFPLLLLWEALWDHCGSKKPWATQTRWSVQTSRRAAPQACPPLNASFHLTRKGIVYIFVFVCFVFQCFLVCLGVVSCDCRCSLASQIRVSACNCLSFVLVSLFVLSRTHNHFTCLALHRCLTPVTNRVPTFQDFHCAFRRFIRKPGRSAPCLCCCCVCCVFVFLCCCVACVPCLFLSSLCCAV